MEVLSIQYNREHGLDEFLKKLGLSYAAAAEQAEQIKYSAIENALSQLSEPLRAAASTLDDLSPTRKWLSLRHHRLW